MRRTRHVKLLVLLLPLPLILSMAGVFVLFTQWWGGNLGYVLSFLVYWLIWCLMVPAVLLGRVHLQSLLRPGRPLFARANLGAAALWLVVTIVALIMYLPDALAAPGLLFAIAVPVGTLNGFFEEVLWRGLYLRTFSDAPLMAWVYPAIPFALWHFVPQLTFPAEGGTLSLVLSTLFLGLAYGYVTWKTESVRWAAISHGLSGVIALGGAIAPSIHRMVGG